MPAEELASLPFGEGTILIFDTTDYSRDLHAKQRCIVEYRDNYTNFTLKSLADLLSLSHLIKVSLLTAMSTKPGEYADIVTALSRGRLFRVLEPSRFHRLETVCGISLVEHAARVEESELRYVLVRSYVPVVHLVEVRFNLINGALTEVEVFKGENPPSLY
jgi:hypothetical protein